MIPRRVCPDVKSTEIHHLEAQPWWRSTGLLNCRLQFHLLPGIGCIHIDIQSTGCDQSPHLLFAQDPWVCISCRGKLNITGILFHHSAALVHGVARFGFAMVMEFPGGCVINVRRRHQ